MTTDEKVTVLTQLMQQLLADLNQRRPLTDPKLQEALDVLTQRAKTLM